MHPEKKMLKDSSFTISNLFPGTTHFNISFSTSFGTSLLLAKFSNAESLKTIYLVRHIQDFYLFPGGKVAEIPTETFIFLKF